ncbi:C6 zinc finger domain-containing protein, partial [Colletotrichum tofieldiae]
LETVVRSSRHEPPGQPAFNFATPPVPTLGHFQSPDIEWVDAFEIRYTNVNTILTWPIFHTSGLCSPVEDSTTSQPEEAGLGSRPLLVSEVDARDASRLLEQFLNNFHVFNPVLDIPTIEEHVKHTSLNGFGWDAGSCLVLLVFALGTTVGQDVIPPQTSVSVRQNAHFSRADAFFLAAQKRL